MACFSGHKAGKSNEAGLEAPVSNKPYILPQSGRSLTKPQEEKVKEKVQAIGSKFPVFVKVMTPHDVGRPGPTKLVSSELEIPRAICTVHFSSKSSQI